MAIQKSKGGVTLNVKITALTLSDSIKKLENFTRLVEKLSKEDACQGMTKLDIAAVIG